MFLVAVGFWNFLGAGIFGFLINLPIVSYYEIGTALTANHGHAAMMGVYGMLAVGLALFCLRYLIPDDRWSDRLAKISFWSLNIGLAWMTFATLFPLGMIQLYESVDAGYFEARTLEFLTNDTNTLIEWIRLPGDILFIVGGVLPLLYICYLGVRYRVSGTTLEEPEDILFTEITEPAAETPAAVAQMRAEERRDERRGAARRRLRRVPDARGAGARPARAPLAPAQRPLPHGGLHLPARPRRLGVPGGRAPAPGRHRPRPAPRPLPGQAGTSATPARRRRECTDSDDGREIARALDPWPHSEAGRFHRGVCVVLVVLAALIAAIALVRSHGPAELLLLGAVLALSAALMRTADAFRATPAGFAASPSEPR